MKGISFMSFKKWSTASKSPANDKSGDKPKAAPVVDRPAAPAGAAPPEAPSERKS
jgi:hypothetical protein